MSLTRVSTKKIVTPKIAAQNVPCQYPSAWFEAHPDEKPPLNITLVAKDFPTSRSYLCKQIRSGSVPLDSALTYLYYFAGSLKGLCEDQWVSYEIAICEAGQNVTPLDIFNRNPTQNLKDYTGESDCTEADDPIVAGYILSNYRVLRASTSSYKSDLYERIQTQVKGLTASTREVTDPGDLYRSWLSNKLYNKLVAAIDMFFFRFPDHPLSALRICTTGTRHRDCAGLLSYGYLGDVLGMTKATEVMDWVFLESIATDIDRIMGGNDELTEVYSYFPYQVDLGIVNKSAYSATINPCFFEWAHTIGALMGSARSQNARHLTDKQSSDIFANAVCVSYVYTHNLEFTKAYTDDGEPIEYDDDGTAGIQDEARNALKSKDPEEWLILIRLQKGSLPEPVVLFAQQAGRAQKEPRAGSISEHIHRKAALLSSN